MTNPADEHRNIAGAFTDRVRGVPPSAWNNPAPCDGWVARDVVRHLVEWFPAFLKAGAGVELPKGPSVDGDPVAAWLVHSDGVQALLDDPATPGKVLANPHIGEVALDQAVDRFYTGDVFLHTWDLARATGQDATIEPDLAEEALDISHGLLSPELRATGVFGPEIPISEDNPLHDRLAAFMGRRP